jgi:hypothetical protein
MDSDMHQQHHISKTCISCSSLLLWCTEGHDSFVVGFGQEMKTFFCRQVVQVIHVD